jgi:hypothetical protein
MVCDDGDQVGLLLWTRVWDERNIGRHMELKYTREMDREKKNIDSILFGGRRCDVLLAYYIIFL